MAGANLPAKKYSKKSPTVTRLSFEFTGNGTKFIDIALALSTINRKFYRAGVYYYVNSVEVYNNSTGVCDLHTLPDSWVTKNAWNRGFKIFQKMNALTDGHGMGRPKYHDFKVYMSNRHRTVGTTKPSLHDINNAATEFTADDWEYSQFVSADSDGDIDNSDPANPVINQEADNFFVHMLGDHDGTSNNWNSVGLIKSYGESRARIQPSAPALNVAAASTDPLVNLFDYSTEEQINDIVTNLANDNDEAPYNDIHYVGQGGHMQHVARIGTEQGVGRIGRASGFCAPFGLICVDPWGLPSDDNFRVVLNLAVGTYHGVYAERA